MTELRDELLAMPDPEAIAAHQEHLAELRKNLVLLYELGNRAEKRMIVENVWPNRTVSGRKAGFEPYSWVERADIDPPILSGAPERHSDRTSISKDDKLTDPLITLLKSKQKELDGDTNLAA